MCSPLVALSKYLFLTVCVENRFWQGVKVKFQENLRADFAGAVFNFLTQSRQL